MAVSPLQVVQSRIELSEVPFNAPNSVPCALRYQNRDGAIERIEVDTCDQHTIQRRPVREGPRRLPVPTPIDDAIRNMAIFRRGVVGPGRAESNLKI